MYCKKCSAQIEEDSVFCYKCGAQVGQSSMPPVITAPQNLSAETPISPTNPQQETAVSQQTYTPPQTTYQLPGPTQPQPQYNPPPRYYTQQQPKSKNISIIVVISVCTVLCVVVAVLLAVIFSYRNTSYQIPDSPGQVADNHQGDSQINQEVNTPQNNDTQVNAHDDDTQGNAPAANTGKAPEQNNIDNDQTQTTEPPAIPTDDFGNLDITRNEEQKHYIAQSAISLSGIWSVIFGSSTNSSVDSFFMTLPADVKSGAKYIVDSNAINNAYVPTFSDAGFAYIDSDGIQYNFGLTAGNMYGQGAHYSSKVTISITKWEGMGGYAYGTIDAVMYMSPNDAVNFKGDFKVSIEKSGV